MKISLSEILYSRWPHPIYNLEDTLKRAVNIGYTAVEPGLGTPGTYNWLDNGRIKKVKKLAMELKIELPVANPGVTFNPASPLEEERKLYLKDMKERIRIVEALGPKIMVGWETFIIEGTPYEKAWEWTVDAYKAVAEEVEKKGIIWAIEPTIAHTNLIHTPEDVLKLMKDVGSKNVKAMIDTYHLWLKMGGIGQTPEQWIEKLGSNLVHVHLGDSGPLPVGATWDYTSLINTLKRIGYEGYLGIDLAHKETPNKDYVASRSLEYVKKLI